MTTDHQPRISYFDGDTNDLRYASWTVTYWKIETVPIDGYVGLHTSLALDTFDVPRISFFDAGEGELDFASFDFDNVKWTITKLIRGADVGVNSSLALYEGNPRIAYFDDTHDDLRYAFWDGSAWQDLVVDFVGEVGLHPSLVLDSAGNPRISYYDITNKHLKYAYWTGSAWSASTIDSNPNVGSYSSIDLDSNNNPYIAYSYYYEENNVPKSGNLKLIYWFGTNWVTLTLDNNGITGLYPSIKLDASNRYHIAYYNKTDTGLKFYFWDGGSYKITTLDAPSVGMYPSLGMDGSDNPHIAYFSDYDDDLKYMYYDGISWHKELVDTVGSTGFFPSLALDAVGHPHIAYYSATGTMLKYAYGTGSGWLFGTIDAPGDVGWNPSIAMGPGDFPAVSYYSATLGDLKYATSSIARLIYLPFLKR
jgi:hypothetical protein